MLRLLGDDFGRNAKECRALYIRMSWAERSICTTCEQVILEPFAPEEKKKKNVRCHEQQFVLVIYFPVTCLVMIYIYKYNMHTHTHDGVGIMFFMNSTVLMRDLTTKTS